MPQAQLTPEQVRALEPFRDTLKVANSKAQEAQSMIALIAASWGYDVQAGWMIDVDNMVATLEDNSVPEEMNPDGTFDKVEDEPTED